MIIPLSFKLTPAGFRNILRYSDFVSFVFDENRVTLLIDILFIIICIEKNNKRQNLYVLGRKKEDTIGKEKKRCFFFLCGKPEKSSGHKVKNLIEK